MRTSDAGPVESAALQNAKVLVVEDEWLISTEIEATLEAAGHLVVGVASDADEAIRLAQVHDLDLVLMDIRLRGPRDGIDAAIEIYRRFDVRCIFLSAHVDTGTRERGHSANALAWISKPFSGPQLIRAVQDALTRTR
jgi:CheY-like chemotaxis protein